MKEGTNMARTGEHLPSSARKKVEKSEKKEEISRIINESVQYFNRKPAKTAEEIAERLNEYFAECYEKGQIPTVEDMALALGTNRRRLWDWEQQVSKNPERANLIHQAKEVLAAIDAKLVTEGKIPQVTYIFRAKNYFGLRDVSENVNYHIDPLGDTVDNEVIRRKYLENVYGLTDEIVIEPVQEKEPLLLDSGKKE